MITGLMAAGIVAVAGCSPSKASTSAAAKPSEVTLVVYSAQGYDHAMTAAFIRPPASRSSWTTTRRARC